MSNTLEKYTDLGIVSTTLTDTEYQVLLEDGYVIKLPRKHTAEDITDMGREAYKLIKEHYGQAAR